MQKITTFVLMLPVIMLWTLSSWASGTSSSSWGTTTSTEMSTPAPEVSLYDQGKAASDQQDYQKALRLFKEALSHDRNNPDILNMLAHTQRKLGMTQEALENYGKALKLRPNFPEAREYLGEAYLQAALEQVKILDSYGDQGREQHEDLIKALKDAAAQAN